MMALALFTVRQAGSARSFLGLADNEVHNQPSGRHRVDVNVDGSTSPVGRKPYGTFLCLVRARLRGFAPFIAMLQTSHSRKCYHASTGRGLWCDYPGFWRIFLQAQMTAILVIIRNEFTHDPVKLGWVKDDDFVQQLSA